MDLSAPDVNKPTLQESSPVTTRKSTEEEMDLSAKVAQECIWITIQDLSLIAPDLNEGDDTTDEKAENAIKLPEQDTKSSLETRLTHRGFQQKCARCDKTFPTRHKLHNHTWKVRDFLGLIAPRVSKPTPQETSTINTLKSTDEEMGLSAEVVRKLSLQRD